MAVTNALKDFKHHFEKGTCIDLYIDNTSCQGAINKRMANSDNIASELKKVLLMNQNQGICIKARYIRSEDNPADPVSRLDRHTKFHNLQQLVSRH